MFDPKNEVIKLCAEGMNQGTTGNAGNAAALYMQAWEIAGNDFEKFTAAHYVARQQPDVQSKLKWDETALQHALKIDDPNIKGALPSLYLNIGKCHEDLNDAAKALTNYTLGQSYVSYLPDEGYGKMIRSGLTEGINRVTTKM